MTTTAPVSLPVKVYLWSTAFIPLSQLPYDFRQQQWYKQLRLQPVQHNPQKPPSYIQTAIIDAKYLHMPRFYAHIVLQHQLHIDIHYVDKRVHGRALSQDIQFAGQLKPSSPPQQQAAEAALQQLRDTGGAMLVLACGSGKTVISLYIAHQLQRKTLVLVRSEALLEQWEQRISTFLPGARIGRIQQQRVDVENNDVVICMVQSLVKRQYSSDILHQFGTVILDEAHAMAAPFFHKALYKLPAAYILGLTATPDRRDGLGYALPWLMGNIAFRAEREIDATVTVAMVRYFNPAHKTILNRARQPALASMLNVLIEDAERNKLLLQLLIDNCCGRSRNVLLLTDRRQHVKYLLNEVGALFGTTEVGAIMGGQRAAERNQALQKRFIISTYHFFAEGQDVPRLDTLLLCTPRSNVEQAIGRILRPCADKHLPLIIDVWDAFSIFPCMRNKRQLIYERLGFSIRAHAALNKSDEETSTTLIPKVAQVSTDVDHNDP